MSKAILALNALILVVNAALTFAFAEPDAAPPERERASRSPDAALTGRAFLRVLDSLEGRIPPDQLNELPVEQVRAIRRAVALHIRLSESAAEEVLTGAQDGSVRSRLTQLRKLNRLEIERVLSTDLGEPDLVTQVAAIIVREACPSGCSPVRASPSGRLESRHRSLRASRRFGVAEHEPACRLWST